MEKTYPLHTTLEALGRVRAQLVGMKELLLSNIVLLGEVPSGATTSQDDDQFGVADYDVRAKFFLERIAELGVDECSTDDAGNPVAILKGSDPTRQPIVVAAHLDSFYRGTEEIHFSLSEEEIWGPGVLDNAVGAGAVLSLPELIRTLGLSFKSDLMLVGFAGTGPRSMGHADKRFLANLTVPIRGAVIVEGGELGRLNYYSESMIRADITLNALNAGGMASKAGSNMIVVMNDIIDRILAIELPQKPAARINVGRVSGGHKYGEPALSAEMGIEIRSYSDSLVAKVNRRIEDIVASVRYEYGIDARMERVGSAAAASLGFAHPLVKASVSVMESLGVEPKVFSSESELSAFLARKIPAVTVGVTRGTDYRLETARAAIEPMADGIAQLLGIISAIDQGACDEE